MAVPGILQQSVAWMRAPAIEVGFLVRSLLAWSRGVPRWAAEPGRDFEGGRAVAPAAAVRVARLRQRYDLTAALRTMSPALAAANLARLEQLERLAGDLAVPCGPDGAVRCADLGCGDFHYAPALQQWLSRHAGGERRVVLRGIELDGHGIYRDGHSRADHGRARAAQASVDGSVVRYEVADATAVRLPEQDVVSLFFPFVSAYACLRWGAPVSRLRPRRMLERAVASLRPGGWLMVANQTAAEFARTRDLLRGLPVVRIARRRFASDLVPDAERTRGQVGSLWLRQEVPSAGRGG